MPLSVFEPDGLGRITWIIFFYTKSLVYETARLHPFLIQNNPRVLRKMIQGPNQSSLHRSRYFLECPYVPSSLDLTYSPAVITGYFWGNSSEQHDGIA